MGDSVGYSTDRRTAIRGEPSPVLRFVGPLVWLPAAFVFIFLVSMCGCIMPGYMFMLAPAAAYAIALFLEAILSNFRQRRARLVVGYVEHAIRLQLPLVPFLYAASRSERWATSRRLGDLASAISAGVSLDRALKHVLPELPPREQSLVDAATQNGNLAQALARIVAGDREVRELEPENRALRLAYAFGVIVALLTVGISMLIFVVPKYREIFKDFRVSLPPWSEFVIGLSAFFAENFGWLLLIPFFLGFIYLIGRALRRALTPWWPGLITDRWRTGAVDALVEPIPVFGELRFGRQYADVCTVIADGVDSGRDLPAAINESASVVRSPALAKRLLHWHQGVLQGMDPILAAETADLPQTMTRCLRSMSGGLDRDRLARLLRFLASHYRMKFSRAAILLNAAFEPLTTLILALLVGGFVLALFLPLVKLIMSVSGDGGDTGWFQEWL